MKYQQTYDVQFTSTAQFELPHVYMSECNELLPCDCNDTNVCIVICLSQRLDNCDIQNMEYCVN